VKHWHGITQLSGDLSGAASGSMTATAVGAHPASLPGCKTCHAYDETIAFLTKLREDHVADHERIPFAEPEPDPFPKEASTNPQGKRASEDEEESD
jgi:hypothetical protein